MSGEKDEAVDRGDDVKAVDDAKLAAGDPDAVKPAADEGEAAAGSKDDVDVAAAKRDALSEADEGDEAEDAEKKARDKGIKIPKARLDEVSRKAKAREQELNSKIAALEEKLKSTEKADPRQQLDQFKAKIAALRDQYEELLFDGKKAEARKTRAELTEMEEKLADWKTAMRSETVADQKLQDMKYEAALAKAESQYPVLDPDHESHDPEKEDEVAELYSTYVKAGYRKHLALEKAVKYVLGAPVPPAKEADPEAKQQRDAEARRKAAAADKKQPPALSKAGLDSDKAGPKGEGGIDVLKLSVSAFDKLSEETKAKLRGDTV